MHGCDCQACRARDARRFERIVRAGYSEADLARLRVLAATGDAGTGADRLAPILAALKGETEWDVPS